MRSPLSLILLVHVVLGNEKDLRSQKQPWECRRDGDEQFLVADRKAAAKVVPALVIELKALVREDQPRL
eukprot:15920657-Heterocapsa_arctica.AAC.1